MRFPVPEERRYIALHILYGGSVKPGNAAGLFGQADEDGGLIGGASLKGEDFAAIIRMDRTRGGTIWIVVLSSHRK